MSEHDLPHNRPKRRVNDSIDGMLPSRNKAVLSPQYYKHKTLRSPGQRRSLGVQPSRKRPHMEGFIPTDTTETAPTSTIGDFDSLDLTELGDKPLDPAPLDTKKSKKTPGRIRRWWKNRSRKFKIFFFLTIFALIGGGLLGVRLYSFLHSVFAKSVGNSSSVALGKKTDPSQLNTEGDGRLNILLLGRGGVENEAPDLTDTLLIASIDLQNQTASLLSVPRDMWVNVNGSNMKINAAYSTGKQYATYKGAKADAAEDAGIKSAITAMRNVTGVPIHKYVLTDYKAFRDVVNALGGVDVNVPERIYDGFTGWSFKAGNQTMDGDLALKYARTRHGTARGDFDRNEHQRQLLIAMKDKATSTGIVANPVRLNSLANAVQKNIRTDLSIDEAKTLFSKTKTLSNSSIKSLDLAKPNGPLIMTGNIDGISVVHPVAGYYDYTKIRYYARNNMIDPYIKKEAPTVAVYNGSGKSGAASLVGDVLSGYGYKVLIKETSKETQNQTLVVKMNKVDQIFTDRLLSVRFGVSISKSLPSGVVPPKAPTPTSTSSATTKADPTPDYIIVLGLDYEQKNGPTW
jgi:LCP family protein required for cell wall assembly